MTIQEEIREIIDGVAIGEIKPMKALRMLSDLGVVIKVDRDLPATYIPGILRPDGRPMCMAIDKSGDEVQRDMLKAGYVATIPLIEVK